MGENRTFYASAVNTAARFSWKDIFSDTFKPHTREQKDRTMSAGLTNCTPIGAEMLTQWQKPWLYARVLGMGILLYLLTYLSVQLQGLNMGNLGVLCVIPSAVVPIAVLIFFWELNIPRNISFAEIMSVLLFGSVFVFLIVIFLNDVLGLDAIDNANVACFPEEIAKLVLVCVCLRKPERCYGLNGILIGAAVGAGFAIMESGGYAVYYGLLEKESISEMCSIIVQRGVLAPGGHIVWAALYGGAIALSKGRSKLEAKHFANPLVIITICSAILLHFIWNSAESVGQAIAVQYNYSGSGFMVQLYKFLFDYWFYYIILIVAAWAVLLIVVRRSIQQVVALGAMTGEGAVRHSDPMTTHKTAMLLCCGGNLTGRSITVHEGMSIEMGRAPECSLLYAQDAKGISGHHCRVSFTGGVVTVTDIGSSYGTFLRDGTKLVPRVPAVIPSGEEFYLATPENSFRVTF